MRISDWSSDVCSSDLVALPPLDQGKLDAFAVENDLQVVNCPSVVSAAPQVKLGDDLGEAARYKSLVYGGAGGCLDMPLSRPCPVRNVIHLLDRKSTRLKSSH